MLLDVVLVQQRTDVMDLSKRICNLRLGSEG
jgi:hypothetical protein